VSAATVAPPASPSPASEKRVVLPLTIAVIGSVLAMAGVSAVCIALTGRSAWWSGWIASVVISVLATAVSLVPMALGLRAGVQNAAYGYLGGATARLLMTMFTTLAAVYVFRAPVFTTLVLLMPLYLAALIAECAVLWRSFSGARS